MSASFAYEDPYLRAQQEQGMSTPQKASKIMKEMGRNAYSSGKGFAKVGMLYASLECVIEGVRFLFFCCNPKYTYPCGHSIEQRTIYGTPYRQGSSLEVSLQEPRAPKPRSEVV